VAYRRHDSNAFCMYFTAITILLSTSGTTLFVTRMRVRYALCSFNHENTDG
jgi:hypothetical protein